jgi:hypothetical protein
MECASVLTPDTRARSARAGVATDQPQPRLQLSLPVFDYRYELRRRGEIVASGDLSLDQPFTVGERIVIGGQAAIVRAVEQLLA